MCVCVCVCVCACPIEVGWLCLASHRQRGHLETAPPLLSESLAKNVKLGLYTVPTGTRSPGRHVAVHYTTTTPRQLHMCFRLQATNSSARSLVSIEKSQGFQTVRCLIGC